MGSAAGWNGIPTLGAYCTSKFGLRGTESRSWFLCKRPLLTRVAGAVESLQQEVASFNVKTLLVEPGYFRTEFLNKDNAKYTHTNLEDYKPLCEAVFSSSRATEGNQTGDPVKGVNRVIDIVKGEGYAAGKKFPPWVLLGPDVLAVARKKMEDNLKLLDEWAELSSSTDL
jgi:NAD(P)-dependent dehydrogenase (short-subunit alcohol dehydrogenase family)